MAKIMLVEDDNNLREIYGARLLAEGHEIVTAKDGEEALATAVKEKPELIISDVMMPRISGFDMLDILRNAPETKFTKVIIMTALSQAEDKARADSLGADRYLVKSQVTLEDVARVVKDVLEGKTENESSPPEAPVAVTESATLSVQVPAQPASSPTAATSEQSLPTIHPVESPATQIPSTPEIVPTAEPSPIAQSQPLPNPTLQMPIIDPSATTPAAPMPSPSPAVSDDTAVTSDPQGQTTTSDPPPQQSDNSSSVPLPEPLLATGITQDTPLATTEDQSAPSAPPLVESVASQPTINVELPKLETPTDNSQASKEVAESTPPTATDQPVQPEADNPLQASVGPNLAEALQQEESTATADHQPTEPPVDSPTPSLQPPPATNAPTEPQDNSVSDAEVSKNPLLDESRKKVVIQPIHDMKGPDLNALLEKENKNAAVTNPTDSNLINPKSSENSPSVSGTSQYQSPNAQPNQHDIISL